MKKIFIFLALLTLASPLFFLGKEKARKKQALQEIVLGDFSLAQEKIAGFVCKKNNPPRSFYEGYLLLAKKDWKGCDHKMQETLSTYALTTTPQVLCEIFLTQATSSYWDGRLDEIAPLVDMAISADSYHPALPFFYTLLDYLDGDYAHAAEGFNKHTFVYTEKESSWSPAILVNLFPRSWMQIHRAHALSEMGQYQHAKEILEKEIALISPCEKQTASMGSLFLGLAYLKEAATLPYSKKAPYLNMAAYYLKNASAWGEIVFEKQKVIDELHKSFSPVITHLLIYPELIDPVFAIAKILEEWQETSSLKLLAHDLGDEMVASLERDLDGLLTFCQLFGQTFGGNQFHSMVMERCFLQFSKHLKERDTTTLVPMWQLVNALSETPALYSEAIARLAETEIYKTITLDDPSLTRTQMTLSFYKQIEKNPSAHRRLAFQLLNYGKLLWQREGQEGKGTHLMDIALVMAPAEHKEHLHRELETFLVDLFALAEKANTVRRLSLLHDTLAHFQIIRQSQTSPAKVANHLADGFYLYSTNQYYAAGAHAEWVLKLDPQNQEALRLQGLTYYHQGKYTQALASLKRLDSPDQVSLKALILSDVFSSQESQGQIAQTDIFEEIEDN